MVKKVVIISQDYDGCFSIMTELGAYAEMTKKNAVFWKRYPSSEAVHPWIASIRGAYDYYLDKITCDADEVRVYVGSDRQSFELDYCNHIVNGNGSVFPALKKFCQDKSTAEKPWIFEPLLLSDPLDEEQGPYGRVRGESLLRMINTPSDVQYKVVDPDKKINSKVSMLLNQMWDAYRQNPDATYLQFHFVDDKESLIQDVLKNIKPNLLPPNMTLFVTKFDYIGMIMKEPGALSLRTPFIKSSNLPIKSTAPSSAEANALGSLSMFASGGASAVSGEVETVVDAHATSDAAGLVKFTIHQ